VVRGEQVGLNSDKVRELLEDLVIQETGHKPIVKYLIANDSGFSTLTSYLSGQGGLGRLLVARAENTWLSVEDLHTIGEDRSLPEHPFWELWHRELQVLMQDYGVAFPKKTGER